MEVAPPHKLLALSTLLTLLKLLTLHNVHIVQFEFLAIEQTETYLQNCVVIYHLGGLPYSYKIEGVNKIKGPEEEELVVDWRRRVGTLGVEEEGGWLPI